MWRTAIDSDVLSDLTAPADFHLTYSDIVPDPAAFEAERPRTQVKYIDRGLGDPGNKASIADVEFHALTVADLPAWYDRKAAAKVPYLTWYASRNSIPAIQAVIGGRHMWRWVATLDGTLVIPGFPAFESPDLVQILGSGQLGAHVDLSLVLSPSWNPSPVAAEVHAIQVAIQDANRAITGAGQQLHAAIELSRKL